ncbi:MAG: histidine--tRNA ligase [Oscillospiraceae bacterium]|nr:histidine--tRNA ligase [Oscillospiraceae bacterium]
MQDRVNKVTPKTLPGFMELLPNEQILFNQMMETIKSSYERYGFLPIDTPIIESSEVLLAKAGGETEKQVYSFMKGDNNLALRFDLTVPLAKYVAANYNELSFPFRRYQIGKVYRGERAQRGRFREFYQCDIDVIGEGELDIVNDAEIPSIIYKTFSDLGLEDFTVKINNRKILNGLFSHVLGGETNLGSEIMRVIDKIEKIGEDNVRKELAEIGLTEEAINYVIDFIKIKGTTDEKIDALKCLNIENQIVTQGIEELEGVVKHIRMFGVPEDCFEVDLTIARGLDYYTGTVYETFLNEYKSIGSICSGGRYNDLAEYYTDKKLPGVGISIGLTRLFFILNEIGLIKAKEKSISKVLVVSMIDDLTKSIEIANELREAGINAEIYFDNSKKIKAKFKYADKLHIPYVVIIGEDEIKSGKYTIKNMETGEQVQTEIAEILNMMKQ